MIFIGYLGDLKDGESKGFSVKLEMETVEGFFVRSDSAIFAYRNSCPHTGAPLDWTPDNFLDRDGALIQCAVHGALFQIDTGLCIYGPCINQYLKPLPVEVSEGRIFLATGKI